MNAIRATQALNKRELENAVPSSASWHADYRDTAYVYVGGLPLDLSEGDVITIFSQYGNPTHLNMIRDKETGKSKGFAFLKYEDQRSCDLAVDNLGGADVLGRMLRVDHTRYKMKDDEDEDTYRIERLEAEATGNAGGSKRESEDDDDDEGRRKPKKKRRLLKEEKELQEMLAITEDGEEKDPMREYMIRQKREEVEQARRREDKRERRHDKHRHRHGHRHREDGDERKEGGEGSRRRKDHNDNKDERRERRHRSIKDDEADRRHRKEERTTNNDNDSNSNNNSDEDDATHQRRNGSHRQRSRDQPQAQERERDHKRRERRSSSPDDRRNRDRYGDRDRDRRHNGKSDR